MFRRLSFSLCAIAMAVLACSCAKPRRVVVGVADFVPWCYVDRETGEYTGFDVEFARLAFKRMGMTPVFCSINWNVKKEMLYEGKVDCLWGCFAMNGREGEYSFVGPYSYSPQVVIVRKSSGITSYDGLKGKVVAVQNATTAERAVMQGGAAEALGKTFGKLVTSVHISSCVARLNSGVVDAMVLDVDPANAYVASSGGLFAKVNGPEVSRDLIGVGLRKDDAYLHDKLEKAFDALAAEGVGTDLARRFFGDPERFTWRKK